MSTRAFCRTAHLVYLLALVGEASYAQSNPSPTEILDAIRNTRHEAAPVAMTVNMDWQRVNLKDKSRSMHIQSRVDYRSDGNRLDVREDRFEVVAGTPTQTHRRERVWDGSEFKILDLKANFFQGAANVLVLSRQSSFANEQLYGMPEIAATDGVLGQDRIPYFDKLRLADNLRATEDADVVDGFPCTRVEGRIGGADYAVWVDMANGSNLRRALILPENSGSPIDGEDIPIFEMRDVVITEVQGQFYMTSARLRYRVGGNSVDEIALTWQDIEVGPDFEAIGAFELDIPEGTVVGIQELPEEGFVWENGRAVPQIGMQVHELQQVIDKTIAAMPVAKPVSESGEDVSLKPSTASPALQAGRPIWVLPLMMASFLVAAGLLVVLGRVKWLSRK